MAIADMLPTLDDTALASLRVNASRLEAGEDGARQKQAAVLLPLIDAEMAERDARKPPKPPRAVRAKAKPKAKVAVAPEAAD